MVEAKEASEEQLAGVHSRRHIEVMRSIGTARYNNKRRDKLAASYNSIYFNRGSSEAALLAAGSVVEVANFDLFFIFSHSIPKQLKWS
jgi:histone deacetylase 4/5